MVWACQEREGGPCSKSCGGKGKEEPSWKTDAILETTCGGNHEKDELLRGESIQSLILGDSKPIQPHKKNETT